MKQHPAYKPARKVRLNRRANRNGLIISIITFVLIACATTLCHGGDDTGYTPERNELSGLLKVAIPDDQPEIMLSYTGFDVSFNPTAHQPNYSAWILTADEVDGTIERNSKFKADPDVYGCARLDDYRNSGYDRGHMAPAADMKWSADAMEQCHYLTNICPQNHMINQGRWNSIEQKCRSWAKRDSAAIIICGPILNDIITEHIGNGVAVPKRFFKVVLLPYANPPMATAFIVPNAPTDLSVEDMSTTVDNVEEITGYDFFAQLPDEIETEIERKNNFRLIQIHRNR